jgi:hypothetical protein
MKFILKAGGRHVEDGITYKKGETVDSIHNLVELFPEKFERVGGPLDDEPEVVETQDPPPKTPPPARKPAAKKKAVVEEDEFAND